MAHDTIKSIHEGAVEFLNELSWHDSILHEVRLIRRASADEVILMVDLLDDSGSYSSTPVELTFSGCFAVETTMRWGVLCMSTGEMIMSGEATLASPLLEQTSQLWKQNGFLPPLAEFSLELASTGSRLKVLFQRVGLRRTGRSQHHPAPPPITDESP